MSIRGLLLLNVDKGAVAAECLMFLERDPSELEVVSPFIVIYRPLSYVSPFIALYGPLSSFIAMYRLLVPFIALYRPLLPFIALYRLFSPFVAQGKGPYSLNELIHWLQSATTEWPKTKDKFRGTSVLLMEGRALLAAQLQTVPCKRLSNSLLSWMN